MEVMKHALPILVVLIRLVTLFFADKRGNCVSEQTVISVAVVIWLFGLCNWYRNWRLIRIKRSLQNKSLRQCILAEAFVLQLGGC